MIGIDICEISRFSEMGNLDKFLKRFFTKYEIEYINSKGNKFETIAGIFSAKESVVKAMGTGFSKIMPEDVEIRHSQSGQPYVNFINDKFNNFIDISLSISHDGDYAISIVDIKFIMNREVSLEHRKLLPIRKEDGHKGDFGKVAVIGGSVGMCGSVDLSAKSALRTGSGLVYNLCPNSISTIMQIKALENIVISICDDDLGHFTKNHVDELVSHLEKFDAISFGCGLGKRNDNFKIIEYILVKYKKTIVFDADSICYLSRFKNILKERENIVLTPHLKEFSSFLDMDIEEIKNNKLEIIEKNFKDYKCTLVLKGKNSIIYSNGNIFVNPTGNDSMATAGSGDVLTGIILSYLGQGLNALDSAKLSTYLHGLSGELASYDMCKDSVIASDLIKYLPKAIKILRGNF